MVISSSFSFSKDSHKSTKTNKKLKMKFIIVLAAVIAAACAATIPANEVTVLRQTSDVNADGTQAFQ